MEQESKMEWTPLPASDPQPSAQRVEQRRDKEKTRPSHSSIYEIQPDQAKPSTAAAEAAAAPPETFRVGSSTAEVFSTLFGKSQSRGSVNWVAFEAAMAELGFSVMPKYGSRGT
ncbi:hypothetical protein CDD83_2267 [Cordyceps sp. RAO-2017]|nr:hypothetical protein CDD83_2267 [Cordyceps sp. RAO-2017]